MCFWAKVGNEVMRALLGGVIVWGLGSVGRGGLAFPAFNEDGIEEKLSDMVDHHG